MDNRRTLALNPAAWHLHVRYSSTNWFGKEAPRDELRSFATEDQAQGIAEATRQNMADVGNSPMLIEVLAPGKMPQLDQSEAWYLYVHILTHDGTILQRNVERQLLDPHVDEEEAREALRHLQAYLLGQGGYIYYAAFVPPFGQEAIVHVDRLPF